MLQKKIRGNGLLSSEELCAQGRALTVRPGLRTQPFSCFKKPPRRHLSDESSGFGETKRSKFVAHSRHSLWSDATHSKGKVLANDHATTSHFNGVEYAIGAD